MTPSFEAGHSTSLIGNIETISGVLLPGAKPALSEKKKVLYVLAALEYTGGGTQGDIDFPIRCRNMKIGQSEKVNVSD